MTRSAGLAVTGLGVVTPLGIGREAWRRALDDPHAAAEHAFGREPTVVRPELVPGGRVAEVWDFDPTPWLGKKGHRHCDRLTKMLIVAAKEALADSGVAQDGTLSAYTPERVGLCSATAYGSLDEITDLNRVSELESPRFINPNRFPNTVINSAAGYVGIWEGLRAPNSTIVDGNCGALDAVLSCETHLARGRGDAFLVGGGEVLNEPMCVALRRLGVLDGARDERMGRSRGVRTPSGPKLGEGAAYVMIERADTARARAARVLAHVRGYGSAFEPPPREAQLMGLAPEAVERAVRACLEDAGIAPGEVQAVGASSSGLEPFDAAERTGLARVLGEHVAVAAPKHMWGETFGASGALGLAGALAWLEGAPVAPRVCGDAPAEVSTVVLTAVGFYGNASAVVLQRAT